jgi:hypothetical protein
MEGEGRFRRGREDKGINGKKTAIRRFFLNRSFSVLLAVQTRLFSKKNVIFFPFFYFNVFGDILPQR